MTTIARINIACAWSILILVIKKCSLSPACSNSIKLTYGELIMFNKCLLRIVITMLFSCGSLSTFAASDSVSDSELKYEYLYKTLTHSKKEYSKYPNNVTEQKIQNINREVMKNIESQLNQFGRDGWELVSFDRHYLKFKVVFKRVKKGEA